MTSKTKNNEKQQQKCISLLKIFYYILLILSIIFAIKGSICTSQVIININKQDSDLTESVVSSSAEDGSEVFSDSTIDSEKHNGICLNNYDNFFSFISSIVSLLGLSNIVIASLIVNKSRYKYGYIIYDLLKKNFKFSEFNIFIYFVILCCNLFSIEYKNSIATFWFLSALTLMLCSFIIIYFICNLSKNGIYTLIKIDLNKKIDTAVKNNQISAYKEVSNTYHNIIKFITNQKDGSSDDWLFACECLLKIVRIITDEHSNNEQEKVLNDYFDKKTRYDYRVTDSAIIFYNAFSALYSSYALKKRPLNVDTLDCIHDFFDLMYSSNVNVTTKQKHTVLIAIALWLFLDVEDQDALNMLNDLVRINDTDTNNIKNCDSTIIALCYLYAHIFFYSSNATFYNDSRFQYIYQSVTTDKSLINHVLATVNENRQYYSMVLLLFKVRLIACSTLDDRYIYLSYFPTLHAKVFFNITQVKKNNKNYDLIDEIYSFFHIV